MMETLICSTHLESCREWISELEYCWHWVKRGTNANREQIIVSQPEKSNRTVHMNGRMYNVGWEKWRLQTLMLASKLWICRVQFFRYISSALLQWSRYNYWWCGGWSSWSCSGRSCWWVLSLIIWQLWFMLWCSITPTTVVITMPLFDHSCCWTNSCIVISCLPMVHSQWPWMTLKLSYTSLVTQSLVVFYARLWLLITIWYDLLDFGSQRLDDNIHIQHTYAPK